MAPIHGRILLCVAAAAAVLSAEGNGLPPLPTAGRALAPRRSSDGASVTSPSGAAKAASLKGGALNAPPGEATAASSIFNLINNVAGAGLLTLSSGMAAGAAGKAGVGTGPAGLIGGGLGLLSAFTFSKIGKCCEALGVPDFRGLWCLTIGPKSAWMIDLCIAQMCLSACIIYSGIIGDTFTSLFTAAGVAEAFNQRSTNLLGVTGVALLPLCLLRSLAALGFTSLLGFGAVMYTAMFIVVRALDGTYAPGGTFHAVLEAAEGGAHLLPKFDMATTWGVSPKAFVLASNLGLAYIAHYNAPRYYTELEGRSPKKFDRVVALSFGVLATLYVTVMIMGHNLFGDNCQSNILLNFANSDPLAVGGRVATALSIVFGYPLAFAGLIDGIKGTCKSLLSEGTTLGGSLAAMTDPANETALRVGLLGLATAIALAVNDIGLVVGLTGSIIGASLVYIAPSIITLRAAKQVGPGEVGGALDKAVLRALIPLGLALGGIGAVETIKSYM